MSTRNPFIICKASAGSGKTFTLVREYLRLALAGDEERVASNFRHILAITFTNKAANEMKERIMQYLDDLSAPAKPLRDTPMGTPLLTAINQMDYHRCQPLSEADLRRRAGILRTAILHRYSDLSVSTIDSFMHRIVRTFAHDLGQPVNFEVTLEQDELIEQAVGSLMSLVGTEGHDDLTEAVRRFAVSRMENEKGFNIEGSLTSLAAQLFSEGSEQYLKRLAEYTLADFMEVYRNYTADNRRFEQRLQTLGAEAVGILASAGMDESVCNQGSRGYLSFFNKLASGTVVQPNAYVLKVFEAVDYCGATLCKAKAYTPVADTVAPRLRQIYFDLQKLMGEPLTDYNTRTLLLSNLYSMALLGELDRCLRDYSRDNEVLHLSEFNRLINRIVREEYTPFIYERLGNRYRHFLIDEFQDTSVLQWQNLVPLLENGVSQGFESLVVGDGKQAIYRFRQGDVRQFVALPKVEGMEPHGRTLANATFSPLTLNFRTLPAVVEFNNDFFSWIVRNRYVDNGLASSIYLGTDTGCPPGKEELRQQMPTRPDGAPEGYVDIAFTDPDDREAIAERVLDVITELVGNHGYRYRDIMVLGRTRRELAAIGAHLLEHSEVPQSSAESFYLRGSHAVMALVAALRCLNDPADRVASADLLVRLQRIGILCNGHLDAFLDADGFDLRRELRAEGIDFNPDHLRSLDLYDLCEHLLRILRLDGIDTPYVASLLNRAAAFSARHMQSIADFLRWFDDHPDLSAACSDEGDAVRLLTIHKAKGLEAPVVICPFFTPRAKPYSLWVDAGARFHPDGKSLPAAYVTLGRDSATRFDPDRDREREDSAVDDLNILYVALTRPRERLYIICPQPKGDTLTYSRLLADYLDGRTSFGNPDFCRQPQKDGSTVAADMHVNRLSFPEWSSVVQVASPAGRAVTPLLEDPRRFGIYAHELLADIRHAGDLDDAIRRFIGRQASAVSDDDLRRLQDFARDVVSNPLTSHFFRPDYQVKNECDLTDGTATGRPDRIVFTPDETWVVDFKTGQDLGDLHDRQLRFYCRTLAAMGYPRVSGWLLYLQPTLRLRPVPLA